LTNTGGELKEPHIHIHRYGELVVSLASASALILPSSGYTCGPLRTESVLRR
jgi:hypothetical protein